MSALYGKTLLEFVEKAEEQGTTLKELADDLGVNYNTFKSRVRRARNAHEDTDRLDRSKPTKQAELQKEHENVNNFTATSRSNRIKTLDQLLRAAEVDTDVWEVEHYVENKWDGQMKGGAPVPLYQVKAWLVRNKPLEIEHTIQPVSLKLGKLPKINKQQPSGYRALIVPDIHYGYRRGDNASLDPFHDRRALDVVLQIAQDFWFDDIIVLGDLLDLSEFSDSFVTEPWFYRTTQSSLLEATWYLGQLRKSNPQANISILEGNHEKRYNKAMMNHLQSAYGLRPASEIELSPSYDLNRLLDLESIDAEWIGNYPDGRVWLNNRLHVRHGRLARKHPAHTSSIIIRESDSSVIFGHIHKIERASRTIETRDGQKTIVAGSPGFLGRMDQALPGHKKGQGWQQGFGIVHYDKNDSFLELVEIKNGKTRYGGEEYVAREFLPQLREDTDWEF